MSGLYGNMDDYAQQVGALEDFVRRDPNTASAQFLLGYHYLVQGHQEDAAARFAKAAELRPTDSLSTKFAQSLSGQSSSSEPTGPSLSKTASAAPGASQGEGTAPIEDQEPPPAPPDQLAGTWIANPDDAVSITLTLSADGAFTWSVTERGRTQTIQGEAGYQDEVLILGQQEGPPLSGTIQIDASNTAFTFKPPGAPESVAGLTFTRQPS